MHARTASLSRKAMNAYFVCELISMHAGQVGNIQP
jgi:hypothetical protein